MQRQCIWLALFICKWERLWWANLAKLIVRLIVSDWILCCILPAPRANEASRHFNNLIETVEFFFLLLPNCVPDQIHQTFTCVESRWPKTLGSILPNFAQLADEGGNEIVTCSPGLTTRLKWHGAIIMGTNGRAAPNMETWIIIWCHRPRVQDQREQRLFRDQQNAVSASSNAQLQMINYTKYSE